MILYEYIKFSEQLLIYRELKDHEMQALTSAVCSQVTNMSQMSDDSSIVNHMALFHFVILCLRLIKELWTDSRVILNSVTILAVFEARKSLLGNGNRRVKTKVRFHSLMQTLETNCSCCTKNRLTWQLVFRFRHSFNNIH